MFEDSVALAIEYTCSYQLTSILVDCHNHLAEDNLVLVVGHLFLVEDSHPEVGHEVGHEVDRTGLVVDSLLVEVLRTGLGVGLEAGSHLVEDSPHIDLEVGHRSLVVEVGSESTRPVYRRNDRYYRVVA